MKRLLIYPLCFLAAISGVSAQTNIASGSAADYFNIGSATFIRENPEAALGIVNEGLSLYPQDESLIRLKKLLEEKQNEQQQQQQQQDQQESNQENQPREQPDQSSDEQDSSEQEKNESDEKKENQNQQSDQDSAGEEKDEQQEAAEDMTRSEAEMTLDSLRQLEQAQREQLMQEMIRNKLQDLPPVEKDW